MGERHGSPPNDFSLYENNNAQTIAEFLPTEAPFNLALVLDTSNSVRSGLPLIKKAGIEFAQQLRSNDRIGIEVFNSSVTQLQGFTSDRKQLTRTLDRLSVSTFGGSKVYDAIAQGQPTDWGIGTGRSAIVIPERRHGKCRRIKFDGLRAVTCKATRSCIRSPF